MAGGIDWFRWHHGTTGDRKLALVAKRAGARLGDVIAMWAILLEHASSSTDRGNPGAIDHEAIDMDLDMPEGTAERIHAELRARGMVDPETGRLSAWERRQPKRERDPSHQADAPPAKTSTERSREHRARKSGTQPDSAMQRHATPCNASRGHATPREEKRREEVIPPIPPKGAKSSAIGLKAWIDTVKARGEQPIPEGDPVFSYAEEVGLPIEFLRLAWLEFRHRYTQPEAKRYRDWRIVFRKAVRGNWLKLWWLDPGSNAYGLTTVGLQAQRAHQERAA